FPSPSRARVASHAVAARARRGGPPMAETNPQGTKSTSASQRSDAGGQQARADQGTQQQGSRPGRGWGALQSRSQIPSFGAFGASPFALMRRMMEDLNRMFEDFGSPRSFGGGAMTEGSRGDLSRGGMSAVDWTPAIEAFERDGQLVVRADLPGLSPADVRIEVTDDGLLIEGERRQEMKTDEDGGVYRAGRVDGRCSRFSGLPPPSPRWWRCSGHTRSSTGSSTSSAPFARGVRGSGGARCCSKESSASS